MTGSGGPGRPRSLTRRVNMLEQQIVLRRQRVRSSVTGIKLKIAARVVSPAMLLTAAGIGVVIEQTPHHRGWSLATALDAATASIRLLLSVSSPVHAASGNTTKQSDREFSHR